MNATVARKGVTDAWDFWLSQHPISLGDLVEGAVTKSFTKWLDANEEEILERIAEKVAKRKCP